MTQHPIADQIVTHARGEDPHKFRGVPHGRSAQLLIAVCAGLALFASATPNAAMGAVGQTGRLRAGAAKVDITPSADALSPGDSKGAILPVMSIRDHLHVRAIYFENNSTCGVLVGVEQGAMFGAEPAVQRAAKAVGCPRDHIIVSAVHTHSGGTKNAAGDTPPDNLPNQATIDSAIVTAVTQAKASAQPARVGYSTTNLYINVNKEIFAHDKWYQGADPNGPSDKTLAVVGFIAADGTPIGIYLNYAAHPINYYLTGVLSADFPGDASSYIERRYDDKTVAIFSQGASGDQNALYEVPFLQLAGARRGNTARADDRIGQLEPWYKGSLSLNENADAVKAMSRPLPPEAATAYAKAKTFDDELVHAYGVLMGEASIEALKNPDVNWQASAVIAGSTNMVTCPGRDRLDLSARQGVLPPYKDGDPVDIQVAALRIGDLDIVSVNGEVYNQIATHLKRVSPSSKTLMVTLAAGPPARSGYIYSNAASDHLTFEVIGSRLKPGCAEDAIVSSGVSQIEALAAPAGGKQ
jgi:neutral ceramidase